MIAFIINYVLNGFAKRVELPNFVEATQFMGWLTGEGATWTCAAVPVAFPRAGQLMPRERRPAMRASKIKNLGEVVGKVMATYNDENADYDMDGSGECGAMIARGWDKYREKIVTGYGFANLYHFAAVVAARTTEKWVYFNLGPWGR